MGGEFVHMMLLQANRLCAWYGAAQAVFDVSLHVQRGEVVALTGVNGAGKSSILKALMGLMPRRSGELTWQGRDVTAWPTHALARAGLGYVPEDRRIFTDLTVLENLNIAVQAPRRFADGQVAPHWTLERVLALFPNLRHMLSRPASQMSGGEQQMLTVARTLMGNPLLVLLDEPSEGVAPVIVAQMADAIVAMKAAGVGILLSEQNETFAMAVSDRRITLAHGTVVSNVTPA
jgi:branched-chain amino acid transport system ATP-binding protein